MNSFTQDERSWLLQYSAQDLSRTLVRQYLYQHNLFKTLSCFENEDHHNSKKIVKSTLIKMLSMNNLVFNIKKLPKNQQPKSLLLLLTQYLRGKFQEKISHKNYLRENSIDIRENKAKQFSMNGDTHQQQVYSSQKNFKVKNFVQVNKDDSNEKTKTQDGFYKKKQSPKDMEDIINLNSIQQKNQAKKLLVMRPNTAKPKQHKEQNKISVIYSKINNKSKPVTSVKPLQINQVKLHDKAKVSQKTQDSVKIEIKKNQKSSSNAVTRSVNLLKREIIQKQQANQVKQQINHKINQNQKDHTILSNLLQQQKHKNEEVEQNYFEQFEQEKPIQLQAVPEIQQKKHAKFDNQYITKVCNSKEMNFENQKSNINKDSIKLVQSCEQSNNHNQQTNNNKIQQKPHIQTNNSQISQKSHIQTNNSQISQKSHIQTTTNQSVQISNKQSPQTQQLYKPSANSSKTGKFKLKRTTPQFTKQDNASQMIGLGIKLIQELIPTIITQQPNQVKELATMQQTIKQKQQVNSKQAQVKIEERKIQKPNELNSLPKQNNASNNMRILKKKVKNKQDQAQTQQKYASKFKFDENFVDQPLHGNKEKYNYQKLILQKMTIKPELKPKNSSIILQTSVNYLQKPTFNNLTNQVNSKKKTQKPLSTQKCDQLRKIIYQKGSPYLAKAWHQGFILSPFKQTCYGIKQIQGGPCGIIAAVQCYFLKHMMYISKPISEKDMSDQIRRQNCLIASIADILWKAKGLKDKIYLAVPMNKNFSGNKLQFSSLAQVQIDASSFEAVFEMIWSYKSSFIGQSNHGVTVLVYSIVLTKGIQEIYKQIDSQQNPLIGHHGHCTQQLVNLFISGQAASNCFDGKKQLQPGFFLHGISQKSQFGFLTVFQTLEYIQVGKNLKNPLFPIWIISKQFHYHVIFGNHYLISENNDCQKFDLIYFDGLYACDKNIRLTFDKVEKDQFGIEKQTGNIKNLPLIEQVLLKKWGKRKVDWNGATRIL